MLKSSAFASVVAAVALLLAAPTQSLSAQDSGSMSAVPSDVFQDMSFRSVGPSRGGRVTAVAGHRAHPHTFYMGAVGGGIWKTDNYGQTWYPISDGQLTTGSIGAIRVAESNQDILYAGTGSDGIRSNVIGGRGVFRSDDAGETWRLLGLERTGQVGAVEIHPENPDVAYVAALGNAWGTNDERGIYRTRDGGESWDQILFTSDSVGGIDLELNPEDPDEIYASMWRGERKPWTIISGMEASGEEDGIWKSTDGGESWRYISEGLPTGLIGKIDLAVTPANPDLVMAVVETTDPDEGVYRSDDRGETWRLVSNQQGLMNRPFYYTNIDIDPVNPDRVFVNNEGFYVSLDGGVTFERRPTPHGDNHDMWINPDDPSIWVQSNDGGSNVTLDDGATWSTQHNQPTAELYQVDVDDNFPYWLYAGQQDNSTIMLPSDPPEESAPGGHTAYWKSIGGCETGPVVPKPDDPEIVYANCKGRFGRYSQGTGQEKQYYVGFVNLYGVNPAELPYRFQRTVPIEVSEHDPGVVYHGSQYVHKTTDEGVTWETISPDLTAFRPERQQISGGPITRDITGEEHYSVLYSIEESPLNPDVIWTGANDGPVHVTRNGGETWTDVTPPDMPTEGRINIIDPSPHDPAKAYFAGYRTLLGDFTPFIYKTEDYGESWTLLTDGENGIPGDYPARVIREDTEREGLLYAGTEFGIFVSFDDGESWQPFQFNLPTTPITDMKLKAGDLVVSTMGRGFWIMDDLSPVRQWGDAVTMGQAHLFQPSDAYRLRGGGGYSFSAPAPDEPEWSPTGVYVDYHLSEAADNVMLEFLDTQGNVLRSFGDEGEGVTTEERQEMRAPYTVQIGEDVLDGSEGVHRFVWDLTVPGPESDPDDGPMVVPGDYQVRLTVDGQSQTRDFEVLMDPRVIDDGVTVADLQDQFDLALEIIAAMDDAGSTIDRLEEAMARAADGSDVSAELAEIEAALVTDPNDEISSYPQPMLASQLDYLYGNSTAADQKPGEDMYTRLEVLKAELEEHKANLERLVRTITQQDGDR